MGNLIACCGNRCDLCPSYFPNLKKYKKSDITNGWLRHHNYERDPDSIGCVGCLINGKHDRENCPIKICCESRDYDNCSECPDMICDLLKNDINVLESAKKRFSDMPEKDYRMFFYPYQVEKH